eukprot:9493690-Pyramimonas_sp.AAC.1
MRAPVGREREIIACVGEVDPQHNPLVPEIRPVATSVDQGQLLLGKARQAVAQGGRCYRRGPPTYSWAPSPRTQPGRHCEESPADPTSDEDAEHSEAVRE